MKQTKVRAPLWIWTAVFAPVGAVNDGNSGNNYAVTFANNTSGAISTLAITVTAVTDSKVYDGTTSSDKTPTITPALASGDSTTLLAQAFQTRDVGVGNKVIIPLITINDGNGGANYTVTLQNCITGTINPPNDTGRPLVMLASPAPNALLTNAIVTLQGSAHDDVEVARVLYQLNSGTFQTAQGTTNWSADLILTPGTNIVAVKSIDVVGKESSLVVRSFFYSVVSRLAVEITGSGLIIPDLNGHYLEIGRTFTIVATPTADNLFSNWLSIIDGTTNEATKATKYTFFMRTNLVLQANFITNRFKAAAGTYYGLFSDPLGVAHQSAGFFSLKTTSRQTFSGRLWVDGQAVGFAGLFNQSGMGTLNKLVYRNGKDPLSVALQLAWDGSDRVTGVVSNCVPGGWVAEMLGNRDVHTETQTETTRAGRYTMVVGGGTNAAVEPAGDGYGLISLKSNGRIVCSGGLGDGHQLKPVKAVVSKNGDWPLYAMMYKSPYVYTNGKGAVVTTTINSGSVISWMKFTTNGTSRDLLDGSLIWNKTGWTNPVCPRGFTNEVQVLAAAYTEPPASSPALPITWYVSIIVKDGNLSLPFTNYAALGVNDTFAFPPMNANMQTLKINRKTGMVQGQFFHPDNPSTTKVTPTYGAVLQDDRTVRGYFIGTNQSGSIRIPEY